jgi:hypothetical protein
LLGSRIERCAPLAASRPVFIVEGGEHEELGSVDSGLGGPVGSAVLGNDDGQDACAADNGEEAIVEGGLSDSCALLLQPPRNSTLAAIAVRDTYNMRFTPWSHPLGWRSDQ